MTSGRIVDALRDWCRDLNMVTGDQCLSRWPIFYDITPGNKEGTQNDRIKKYDN
jgi:hypothetical protein